MLRITAHDDLTFVTFRLEGGLAGIWVQELERCWRQNLTAHSAQEIRFDLTDVTFVDATGKAFLATRHAEGAQLVASGCMTSAIIAEIAGDAGTTPIVRARIVSKPSEEVDNQGIAR